MIILKTALPATAKTSIEIENGFASESHEIASHPASAVVIQPAPKTKAIQRPANIQGTLSTFVKRPMSVIRTKAITEAIFDMIVLDFQPFSIVEDRGFKRLVKLLEPSYNLPSRFHLSNHVLPNMYDLEKNKMLNAMEEAESVSLTTDTWTSNNTQSYMAITAHYINKEWVQKSILLGCAQLTERHTAVNLKEEMLKVAKFWNIDKKVRTVTTDNAANIVAAVRETGWTHIPCMAHTLNLVVQAASQTIEILTKKVKAIVGHFHRSTTANAKFFAMQTQLNSSKAPLKLKMDVVTRWNSTFIMYERVCELQEPLEATLGLLHNPVPALTSEEWDVLKEVCQILKPFDLATTELSAEKNISISKVIPMVAGITRAVTAPKVELKTASGKKLTKALLTELNTRFENVEKKTEYAFATFLDPRFRQKGFMDSEETLEAVEKQIADMIDIESDLSDNETRDKDKEKDIESAEPVKKKEENPIWEHFDNTIKNLTARLPLSVIELRNYKDDIFLARAKNPLQFWQHKGSSFPRLKKMAKKYLVIPATSVPSERVFSKAGDLVSEKRNRLKPENVDKILFLNANTIV